MIFSEDSTLLTLLERYEEEDEVKEAVLSYCNRGAVSSHAQSRPTGGKEHSGFQMVVEPQPSTQADSSDLDQVSIFASQLLATNGHKRLDVEPLRQCPRFPKAQEAQPDGRCQAKARGSSAAASATAAARRGAWRLQHRGDYRRVRPRGLAPDGPWDLREAAQQDDEPFGNVEHDPFREEEREPGRAVSVGVIIRRYLEIDCGKDNERLSVRLLLTNQIFLYYTLNIPNIYYYTIQILLIS